MSAGRTYPVQITRRLVAAELAACAPEEADRGEEEGFYGNQRYCDLRGVSWDQAAKALDAEAELLRRFAEAVDLDAEADAYEEERAEALTMDEDFCGLDVGVIGVTFVLSALGCTTVSSCNAGGFGGRHVASYPYVAFFLPQKLADEVLRAAESAEVGLDVIAGGIARLFGRGDPDLHRFAALLLRRRDRSSPKTGRAQRRGE